MTTGGEGNIEPKTESKIRKFFRAFLSFIATPREPLAMYARDWPELSDDRVAALIAAERRRHTSIRGLY